MTFDVNFTDAASADLVEIYEFLCAQESTARANDLIGRIEQAVKSLAATPDRGHYPAELIAIGMREYRELLVVHYRVVYRVIEQRVYILVIADSRRDMNALLQRRLLA